jgi:hypothetical protein
LLAGLAALELTAARAQRRAQLPENVGQSWTTEEERELVAASKNGDSPTDIARKHGRTLRAIEARLEKLGLITTERRATRGGFERACLWLSTADAGMSTAAISISAMASSRKF